MTPATSVIGRHFIGTLPARDVLAPTCPLVDIMWITAHTYTWDSGAKNKNKKGLLSFFSVHKRCRWFNVTLVNLTQLLVYPSETWMKKLLAEREKKTEFDHKNPSVRYISGRDTSPPSRLVPIGAPDQVLRIRASKIKIKSLQSETLLTSWSESVAFWSHLMAKQP